MKFVDVLASARATLTGSSPCPVLGWAEHIDDDDGAKSDADLLRLMKIEVADVDIVRHKRGFIALKRPTVPEVPVTAIAPFVAETSTSAAKPKEGSRGGW